MLIPQTLLGRVGATFQAVGGGTAVIGALAERLGYAQLGWQPTTTLEQLCQMMVDADLRRNQAGFSF